MAKYLLCIKEATYKDIVLQLDKNGHDTLELIHWTRIGRHFEYHRTIWNKALEVFNFLHIYGDISAIFYTLLIIYNNNN